MAFNLCNAPSQVSARQTLFLGCSIISFTVNVGWNQQVGQLTVELVQDTCPVPVGGNAKIYYDNNLQQQTTMAADPGFIEPNIGAPVYFRVGNFEWCGLVQSFQKNMGMGGRPVYSVVLVDPRQVLQGTQVIINNYAGSTHGMPNIINAFGYHETFGVPAPLTTVYGNTFGSPADAFGGSATNDNGMPWYSIAAALQRLTSDVTPYVSQYSPGRIQFRDGYGIHPTGGGANQNVGYGIIPGDTGGISRYVLDLSEMPVASQYWKIAGTSVSILDAITDICNRASCDYYIELQPALLSGSIYKVIKVRSVSRSVQPSLSAISDFINSVGTTGVIEYSTGKELRVEPVASFVFGGPQQNMYEVYGGQPNFSSSDVIRPFFGFDPITGNAIDTSGMYDPFFGDTRWAFRVNISELNAILKYPLSVDSIVIKESELLATTAYDQWQIYSMAYNPESLTAQQQTIQSVFNYYALQTVKNVQPSLFSGIQYKGQIRGITALSIVSSSRPGLAGQLTDDVHSDTVKIYEFIRNIAENYYGQKFMVALPYIAAKIDSESTRIQTTDQPTDGAWAGDANQVLMLPHPTYTDFFALEDGRIGPMCSRPKKWYGKYTDFKADEYLTATDYTGGVTTWLKSTVEPDIAYLDKSTRTGPYAIISIPGQISNTSYTGLALNRGIPAILDAAGPTGTGIGATQHALYSAGGAVGWTNMMAPALTPWAAAVPILSNVQTYGPWYSNNGATVSGPVRVEQDQGLVPWQYTTNAIMDYAGLSKVYEGVGGNMQVGEMGTITVPGYPLMPLGAELGAYYNGVFGAGFHLFEHRTMATGQAPVNSGAYMYVPMTGWTGLYGPSITSISVRVGLDKIETSYSFQTFTPQYGRFSRANAERLRNEALRNIQLQKQSRLIDKKLQALDTLAKNHNAAWAGGVSRGDVIAGLKNVRSNRDAQGRQSTSNSPHHILVGQNVPYLSGTNTAVVATVELEDIMKEYDEGFAYKSFMSMEGLLRPVSVSGLGGLPRFVTGTGNAQYNRYGGLGPLLVPTGTISGPFTGSYMPAYNLNVNSYFLNPFMSQITHTGDNMRGNSSGHDIAILGIGTDAPVASGTGISPSLNLYINGTGVPKYETDYRFLCMRGPIVLQGWGYDLDGKPIPNKVDTPDAANSGIFSSTGLQDKFMDGWLTRSESWPVGPIDLRFDRNRGVWTVPQYQLTVGMMISDISSGGYTGLAQLAQNSYIFDASGNRVNTSNNILPSESGAARFNVSMIIPDNYDVTSNSGLGYNLYSGEKVISLYSPEQNAYIPIGREQQVKLRGVLVDTLEYSGSCRFNIWTYQSGVGEVDTGETIRVYDWLLNAGQTVIAGTRGVAYKDVRSQRYYLLEASCQ